MNEDSEKKCGPLIGRHMAAKGGKHINQWRNAGARRSDPHHRIRPCFLLPNQMLTCVPLDLSFRS